MKLFRTLILTILIALPAAAGAKDGPERLDVIPHPNSVEYGKGHFKAAGAIFNCETGIDERSLAAIRDFAEKMTYVSGYTSTVAVPGGSLRKAVENGKIKGFVYLIENAMEPEEYSIEVTGRNCIVRAADFNGFLYATQTLKQLVDASVFGEKVDPSQKFLIPCMKISDKPRFAYRGLHLDCSRHFFPVEEVMRVLDIMALYKLNRFHWHLTDDQGWRIEIKKYPRLTSVGAFRAGTMIEGDKTRFDGVRHGGYYTQDQIREVVSHAASLGIEVIPEIDLPGHMSAAIAAYPGLSCHDDPMEVPMTWGVFERTLCPGKDATFTFLEDVFTEILDLFPYEYYHIGGDECPKTEWKDCPVTHNIPSIGFVVTLTTGFNAYTRSWTDYNNDEIPQYYLSAIDGQMHVFTEEMASDPAYRYMYEIKSTSRFTVSRTIPTVVFNLNLSKEIGKNLTASFYVNNIFNSRPLDPSEVGAATFTELNNPMYFGFELKVKLFNR